MKKVILFLTLMIPLFLQAQIRADQIRAVDENNDNVPANYFLGNNGSGRGLWGIIDTTKVDGLEEFVINNSITAVTGSESAFDGWDKNQSDDFIPSTLLTDYGFTDNSTNWNTAYSWVNTNGANAVTAYGWGNHASAGYAVLANIDTEAEFESALFALVVPSELTSALATKQDVLVSGTNIKTINGQSILGSGNIEISGGSGTADSSFVTVTADTVKSNILLINSPTSAPAPISYKQFTDGYQNGIHVESENSAHYFRLGIGNNGYMNLAVDGVNPMYIAPDGTVGVTNEFYAGTLSSSGSVLVGGGSTRYIKKNTAGDDILLGSPKVGEVELQELINDFDSTLTLTYSTDPIFDVSLSNSQKETLTGDNDTLYVSNLRDGQALQLEITQNATGGYGINNIYMAGMNIIYKGGIKPTAENIDSAANKSTVIQIVRFASNLHVYFDAIAIQDKTFPCSDLTSDLAVADSLEYWIADRDITITGAFGTVLIAPTGANLIGSIDINGTTAVSNIIIQADSIRSTYSGTQPTITTSAVSKGDVVTFNIDQIGSTATGKGLNLGFYYKEQ